MPALAVVTQFQAALVAGAVTLAILAFIGVGKVIDEERRRRPAVHEMRIGTRVYSGLAPFVADVELATGLKAIALAAHGAPRLENAAFEGTFAGRRADVAFEGEHHGRRHEVIVAALGMKGGARFHTAAVRRVGAWARAARLWLTLASGDRAFDERHFTRAPRGHGDRARRALEERDVRAAIDELFATYQVQRLDLTGDRIAAEAPAAVGEPSRVAGFLSALARLATLAECVSLEVKVLGGERRALAGERSRARCAYCHADLRGDEPDLVACEKCATVLHAACWEDLGRCPVMGCGGATPERAKVRP